MSRARAILRRAAIGLGVAALLVAIAAWVLLGTSAGAAWLVARTGALMPGEIEIGELDGPIRGPLTIGDLVYRTDSMVIEVEHLELEWRLRDLLAKQLDITRLYARGVTVFTEPSDDEEPSPLPDVHLPINIIVRDALVESMLIEGEPPTRIDRIELETTAAGSEVIVDRLEVISPDIDLLASGRVEPVGDYPVDLEVRWEARLADLPPLAGEGLLGGTLETLRVEHRLSRPAAVELDGALTTPLRDLSFDLATGFEGLDPASEDLSSLELELPLADLSGRLRLVGRPEDFTLSGPLAFTVTEDGGDLGRFGARAEVRVIAPPEEAEEGAPTRIEIARVALEPRGAAGTLSARGEVVAAETPRFALELEWSDLSWPPAAPASERLALSPTGEATVEGTADAYVLTAAARVESEALPAADWRLEAEGDSEGFGELRLAGDPLGGALRARGELSWSPEVRWDLALEGESFDPAVEWPELPGELAFTGDTRGVLEEAGPRGTIAPLRLDGTLRGEPLAATAALTLTPERTRIDALDLDWAGAKAEASGSVGSPWDLRFRLDAERLAPLYPDLRGSLQAEGTLSGDGELPALDVRATASGIGFGDLAARALEAEVAGDLNPGGALDVTVAATAASLAGTELETLALDLEGTPAEHALAARAVFDAESVLSARLAGASEAADWPSALAAAWRGRVEGVDYRAPSAGRWRQRGPARLAIAPLGGPEEIEVAELCLVADALPGAAGGAGAGSRLCAAGGWDAAEGWSADAELAEVPLAVLDPLLPPDSDLSGRVGGTLSAALGSGSPLVADLDLAISEGRLRYELEEPLELGFGPGTIAGSAGGSGIAARLDLPLKDGGAIEGELAAPAWSAGAELAALPLDGRLDARLADLSWLPAVLPALADVRGALLAEATLDGTVGAPEVVGTARLENAAARVPELGIALTEVELTARGDGDQTLAIEGSARSGEGTLRITGSAGSVPGSDAPVRLAIAGERFEAMDTPEIHLLVSPDLEVEITGERVQLRGEVVVPEAEIEIEKLEEGAVEPSSDVVIVSTADGEEVLETASGPLEIDARVRVVLGDDVEVEALGLTAEPEGSLLITQAPGGITRASGELDLSGGKYEAYGQDLTIERGRLVFGGGPVDNPGVDLRASRTARDGTVAGIEVEGTLRRPRVELWSEPDLGESDQLSYLLLGRPLEQTEQSDGDLLTKAAGALGLRGGNFLAERLGARFGLEEAKIETDGDLEEASLVVGKYLSPDLYIGYGIGLFEPVSTFRIRYILSSKWSLEAETGLGTSADFFYTIETGGD